MSENVKSLVDVPTEEFLLPGHAACAGCGSTLALRLTLKALGKNTIVTIPASCVSVIQGPFPLSSIAVPVLNVALPATGAVISGMEAVFRFRKEKRKIVVLGFGGDGATADIGLQTLSGAFERGHGIVYVCHDNEAYMNTGIQRSSATPFGAWTTTTPIGRYGAGKRHFKKDMPAIFAAHRIPCIATASVAYPLDLMQKLKRAQAVGGPAYVHIHCPCPPGWRFPPSQTIKLARLAVGTGMWVLYEIENGDPSTLRITVRPSKRRPVAEYLRAQGRFQHLPEREIRQIQKFVDENCERLGLEVARAR